MENDDSDVEKADQFSVMHQSRQQWSNSSEAGRLADWFIDLKRFAHRAISQAPVGTQEDFRFSVYTWFLDHNTPAASPVPKLVFLDDDSEKWEESLLRPWRHHIGRDERVFIDLVQPPPPTAAVEDHVTHILLTQHQTELFSI